MLLRAEKFCIEWNNTIVSIAPEPFWSVLNALIKIVITSLDTVMCLIPKATTSLTLSNAKKANVKADWNNVDSKFEKHKRGKTLTIFSNKGKVYTQKSSRI